MRDTTQRKLALLVTDDPAVEDAVRVVAQNRGDILHLLTAEEDATSVAFDALASETFAIVDIEAQSCTRAMFSTLAGLLPVIAITHREEPWLKSLLRLHRIQANVTKPVKPGTLQNILHQIGEFHEARVLSGH
jgi:hypothetical protein